MLFFLDKTEKFLDKTGNLKLHIVWILAPVENDDPCFYVENKTL